MAKAKPKRQVKGIRISRVDPTRTYTLRRAFTAKLKKKFARLKGEIYKLVVEQDIFGLTPPKPLTFNKELHKYASTQFDINDGRVTEEIQRIQDSIDPNDILELETKPHVTIRYGLHDEPNLATKVTHVLASIGPVIMKIGSLSLFSSPENDVLKFDIDSPRLHELNRRLKLLPHTQTHQTYQPHLTVAYLRPGTGYKYVQPSRIAGLEFMMNKVTFSDRERNKRHFLINFFCPTGVGGGIDPTCSKDDSGRGGGDTNPIHTSRATAIHELRQKTRDVEHQAIISAKDGKRIHTDTGGWGHTNIPIEILTGNEPINQLHTHPGDDGPSDADWGMMGWSNVHRIDMVGLDKVHTLEKEPGTYVTPRELRERWNAILEEEEPKAYKEYGDDPKYAERLIDKINERMTEEFKDRGIKYTTSPIPTTNTQWMFHTLAKKIEQFQQWLRSQFNRLLRGKSDEQLWAEYINQGWMKGAARAFDDQNLRKKVDLPRQSLPGYALGAREQFLQTAFGRPVAVEKVQLLAGRAFDDLEGITEEMSIRMSRSLTDGLVQGLSPRDVARQMNKVVDLGQARAETIARTELIRAHNEGQLEALEQLGVEEVGVAVEWTTTPDNRLCRKCEALQGVVLKLKEARGMLPLHPMCRCTWIPANVGEEREQKRSRTAIEEAFEEADEDYEVDDDRPESILNAEGQVNNPEGCNQYTGPGCSASISELSGRTKAIADRSKSITLTDEKVKDGSTRIEGKWGKDAIGGRSYLFTTSSGTKYEVSVVPKKLGKQRLSEVSFEDDSGRTGITGVGSAHEVITETTAAITALVKETKPDAISFTAAEKSRQKLYDRVSKTVAKILPDYGVVAMSQPVGEGRQYLLVKKEKLEDFRNLASSLNPKNAPEILSNYESILNRFSDTLHGRS